MKLSTLLCCINPNDNAEYIDEYSLYHVINPVSPVINIKIFDRESQVKAFVQVTTKQNAELIANTLHGKFLKIGKIKVYESHKKFIAFDRTVTQILAQGPTCSSENRNYDIMKLSYLKTIKQSFHHIEFLKRSSNTSKEVSELEYDHPHSKKDIIAVDSPISYKLFSKPNSPAKHLMNLNTSDNVENFVINRRNTINNSLDQDIKRSREFFIKVSNINIKKIDSKVLFNLFGCFGNVSKMLFQPHQGVAILQFENEGQVQSAIKYSDCIVFFKMTLNVDSYCGTKLSSVCPKTIEYNSFVHFNNIENFRFEPGFSGRPQKPSRYIAFSGFHKETSNSIINDFINQLHKPMRVQKQRKEDFKLIFVAEYEYLHESIQILSTLHGITYQNLFISASFVDSNGKSGFN